MKRYLVIFSLLALSFAYQTSYAQEIPDNIKAKIIEVADAKKLSKDQRNEWITRQIESWMVVTAAQFDLPKKDVDKLKAEAQEKYPWVYSKQETYIMAQAESLQEINQLKSSFDKGEFDALMAVYQKKYNGDYKKIAEQLYSDVEIKAEIRDMQIEGQGHARRHEESPGLPVPRRLESAAECAKKAGRHDVACSPSKGRAGS